MYVAQQNVNLMAGMMLLQSFLLLLKLVTVGYESASKTATIIYADRYRQFGETDCFDTKPL
jgi:hypothetical protein